MATYITDEKAAFTKSLLVSRKVFWTTVLIWRTRKNCRQANYVAVRGSKLLGPRKGKKAPYPCLFAALFLKIRMRILFSDPSLNFPSCLHISAKLLGAPTRQPKSWEILGGLKWSNIEIVSDFPLSIAYRSSNRYHTVRPAGTGCNCKVIATCMMPGILYCCFMYIIA